MFINTMGNTKSNTAIITEDWVDVDIDDTASEYDSEEEEDMECDEEMMNQILADAKRLRFMADAFLHPEKPVESTGCYCDGCYYDRPSAPPRLSREEADEQAQILADAASLGQLAHAYAHPEEPVVTTDPTACARCYYDRPSAPAQLSVEDAEEQAAILADLDALKKAARDYLHPELPVVTTDPTACGRNYFTRYSAPEQESVEQAEYRAAILADAAALKQHAVWHAHPELPVVTTDPTACGRNYFTRYSAPEQESVEQAEYRAAILADAAALKQHAVWHAHPELPVVTTDPAACGRNYFTRYSATEQESVEQAEYRAAILADAAALKQHAVWHAHPELPVVTTDPAACGRNYFTRYSATEQESVEQAEYRAAILADAAALKQHAVWHAHPELPVVTTDPAACGRNYFTRYSAPEQESVEQAEYRAAILADAAALKQHAVWHAHPELPVVTTDPAACGRNYFTRYSAPEQESVEQAEYRAAILADAAALKQHAVWHAHPELPVVTTDPAACGRNYFTRYSAPEQESVEQAEYRAAILADAAALKQHAVWHAHPELPVVTTDPAACGRNYFTRYSAPEQESVEQAEYRAAILADAAALKQHAVWHAHPELPVVSSPEATARCYFDRASAPHDAEQIVSTSAYAVEKKEEESLEKHMATLESLAPATRTKTAPAIGPCTSVVQSASNVQLYDLEFA